jgi:hypothetical protein
MSDPELFIGVVSHSESSYLVNQGRDGFAALLAKELTNIGVSCLVSVNLDNLYTESGMVPTRQQARQGIRAEAKIAREWKRYLGRRIGLKCRIEQVGQWGKSVWNGFSSPDVTEISRLRNIEESHLRLFLKGLESSAAWILILEDDAYSPDVTDLSLGLRGIMESTDLKFANLSHSFTYDELGIRHLLRPSSSTSWVGTSARSILSASRPATNTVCAILYQRLFLQDLVAALGDIPENPVVPIDWRLNMALMAMWESRKLRAEECWFIDPAPIVQLSMRN